MAREEIQLEAWKRLSKDLTSKQTHLRMLKKEGRTVLMSNPTWIPLEFSMAPIPTKNVMMPPSITVLLN